MTLKEKINNRTRMVALIIVCLMVLAAQGMAAVAQKIFVSPEEAVSSLIDALTKDDLKALQSILGPDGESVLSSGDAVADKQRREQFLEMIREKHTIEADGQTKAVLVVGKDDWPYPIPVVNKGKGWYFDTKEGKEEILNRRIGKNELNTIQTMLAIVDAQREYAMKDPDSDGILEYAEKFRSDVGKKNGLYWETKEGEESSPLGELAAKAWAEGYNKRDPKDKPDPYHGYYYRMLMKQGKSASGGAYDYIVKGNMIGGFAVVAYPAEYGNSGIMTFIVNHDGVVYQKDIGKNTEVIAKDIKIFDPDKTWNKVE